MSVILGAIFFLALAVGVVATMIAIAKPRLRAASTVIASFGFLGAAACVGVFILAVSRMT